MNGKARLDQTKTFIIIIIIIIIIITTNIIIIIIIYRLPPLPPTSFKLKHYNVISYAPGSNDDGTRFDCTHHQAAVEAC